LLCEKELGIRPDNSNKEFPTYHFYHKNNFSDCDWVNGRLPKNEIDKLNKIFASKETQRHKYLKEFIRDRLFNIELVEKQSIKVEKWIYQNGKLERKPDVYCIYKGLKVAFEVQISELSQSYMLERYNYYKNEEIYVLWIVDKFDFENNRQFIKDLQELNNYQNIFRLNEESDDLILYCSYPEVYITKGLGIKDRIIEKQVSFINLNFDDNFQIFHYDYPNEIRNINIGREQIIKNRKLEIEQIEIERKSAEEQRIKEIETNWQNKWVYRTKKYSQIKNIHNLLTEHCYLYIMPNEMVTVFFPETGITRTEIQFIEENYADLLWVIKTENIFQKGDVTSKVSNYLNTLELNYNQKDSEDFRNNLVKTIENLNAKKENKNQEIERLEKKFLYMQNELKTILEIREKILLTILGNGYYFDYYDLIKSITETFKEQLLNINGKSKDIVKEQKGILAQLNEINNCQDIDVFGKILKKRSSNPDSKTISEHFENFTILLKSSSKTLIPEVITRDKLRFVFYKPNDYIYLYDSTKPRELLHNRQIELGNLQTENENLKLIIYEQIDQKIDAFLKGEIESLTNNIEKTKSEFVTLLKDYDAAASQLSSQFSDYNSEKERIKSELKGLYSFSWYSEIQKWKHTKHSIFFDTNEKFVFWVNDERQLKRIYYSEFVSKLDIVKNTKKKWL